jgi:hypothetical protein
LTAIEAVRVLGLEDYQPPSAAIFPPVLSGFRLGLIDDEDRQIYNLGFAERINVSETINRLGIYARLSWRVPFELSLPDRRIDWDVEYAIMRNNILIDASPNNTLKVVTGSALGSTVIPIPELAGPLPTVLVISRFRMAFTNGHHKIRRIAVGQKPGTTGLEIAFHDKNADDPFDYEVSYGLLRRPNP